MFLWSTLAALNVMSAFRNSSRSVFHLLLPPLDLSWVHAQEVGAVKAQTPDGVVSKGEFRGTMARTR